MTKSIAIYRMPNQSQVTHISGNSVDMATGLRIDECYGFVIAPFCCNETTPRLLISADNVDRYPSIHCVPDATARDISRLCADNAQDGSPLTPGHRNYIDDYERFHAQLRSGRFAKVVLSRVLTIRDEQNADKQGFKDAFALFAEACERYPRMFVCMFSTPESGTWLVSTPELLIDCTDNHCRTMALAGTMPWYDGCENSWKQKDKDEQRIVAEYIQAVLSQLTVDIHVSPQYTARAAGLAHLRNDFEFTIADGQLGEIVDALFPTPAVCGLPKDETYQFISDNEYSDRRYYSGYCGPVNIDGSSALFVSLRCMSINTVGYDVYAGGGLLVDSIEPDEWDETAAKMQTMTSLIYPQKDTDRGSKKL